MRKLILIIILLVSITGFGQEKVKTYFKEAYQLYPNIPNGLLEALSFNATRLAHILPDTSKKNCSGNPYLFGIMGLTEGGLGLRNMISEVSKISNFSISELKESPRKNILGTANWISINLKRKQGNIKQTLSDFTGMEDTSAVSNFLKEDFALQIYKSMKTGVELNGIKFSIPNSSINISENFDKEFLRIYSNKVLKLPIGNSNKVLSADYPAATLVGTTCYSGRNGTPITDVVIHDMEGYFQYTVYTLFQNCSNQVSSHYCIRSSDGFIVQLVAESEKAWHVGNANPYSIGIEHEGFADNASWYTLEMYTASANLVKDITLSGYGILPTSCYNGPSNPLKQLDPQPVSVRIKGHCHYPLSINTKSHWDPGPYWNWYTYYNLINSGSSAPSNDDCSGATTLTSSTTCSYLSNQTVNNATASGKPKGGCDAYTGTPSLADVWYKFQAIGTSTTITVDPNGSALDAVIVAYNSCTSNTEVSCNDTPGGYGTLSSLTISTTPGNTYYVRIYDYGLQTTNGDFRICITHTTSVTATITNVTFPSAVNIGATFGLTYSITASGSLNNILLGASIRRNSIDYSDASNDNLVSLVNGANTKTRSFNLNSATPNPVPSGIYDVIVALWIDKNGNGIIDPLSDQQFGGVLTKTQSLTINSCTAPTSPTSATASQTTISLGQSTTLQVNGGALNSAPNWIWYTGSCGGTQVGTGATLPVSPTSTTTYYVQASACNVSTTCRSVTITVNPACTAPTSPTSATASQTTISLGQSTTLQVNGGALNSAPNWIWYTGSCGGTQVGTGATLPVSPTSTTTYYVQASACNVSTTCRSVTITVNPACTAPIQQANNVTFPQGGTTSNSIQLSWTNGNGTGGRMVVAKIGNPITGIPENGRSYTDNLAFGSGNSIATGEYVVYSGTGNGPITVNNLSPLTIYYFKVFEYNCTGSSINYQTSNVNGNPNSQVTTCEAQGPPTATAATNNTQTGFQVNWNRINGAVRYYIDISTSPGFTSFVNGYDNKLFGEVTSASVTGLYCSTTYYYRVRAMNGCNMTSANSNTITASTLACCDPITITSQPTNKTVEAYTSTSFTISALGTGLSYLWQYYDGTTWLDATGTKYSGGTTPTLTVNDAMVGMDGRKHRCIVSNSCDSKTSNEVVLTVNCTPPSTPVFTSSTGQFSFCGSASLVLTANSSNCNNCGYQWDNGTGNQSITISNLTATKTFTMYVTNVCGSAEASQTITVISKPVAATGISSNKDNVCANTQVNLSVQGTLSSGATWKWYRGSCSGNSIGSGSSINVTPAATSTYYVRAENGICYSACVSKTISVLASPLTPTIITTPGNTVCAPNNITLSVGNPTSCSNCTYTWSNNTSGTSTVVNTSGNYSVVANNGCLSAQSNAVTITINPVPNLVTTATPNPVCQNSVLSLSASGANTYTWTGDNLNATTGPNVTANPSIAGNRNYSVTGTLNGCSTTATVPVTVTATGTGNCVFTAVVNVDGVEAFSVLPNPSPGVFNVKMKLNTVKEVQFIIFNLLGQEVYRSQVYHYSGQITKQIILPANGAYQLQTRIGKRTIVTKIMITK